MKSISKNQKYINQLEGTDLLIDTTEEKGGTGQYTRPHDLLEAALASCINIMLQKEAEKLELKDIQFETEVVLNRENPEEAHFEYSYKIIANDNYENLREMFDEALLNSSVRKTLSRRIVFTKKE
ncbi:MAG: OsmC family protein [Candidatus Marinarcus sp.]|uniref:OsmC family protein n=1 Tax=Candidatus Marinarcus sp. TaxID=3100987 RepID=UPI003AFF9641